MAGEVDYIAGHCFFAAAFAALRLGSRYLLSENPAHQKYEPAQIIRQSLASVYECNADSMNSSSRGYISPSSTDLLALELGYRPGVDEYIQQRAIVMRTVNPREATSKVWHYGVPLDVAALVIDCL